MASPKTRQTAASVADFLDGISDAQRRQDARDIVALLEAAAGAPARMWGSGIVGCGTYRRTYASGPSQEWMLVAMAPRADRLTIYVEPGFDEQDALLATLGTYRAGKSCIHIKRLADIDVSVLKRIVTASIAHLRARYP